MNPPTLKPGDVLRITSPDCCCGCILKYTDASCIDNTDTGGRAMCQLTVLTPHCFLWDQGNLCRADDDETYEILTPEEAMEIELSR